MEINGTAYQSPGDGGELYIEFDFSPYREEIIKALKEFKDGIDEDTYLDDDGEDFFEEYLPELMSIVEKAFQGEAESLASEWGDDGEIISSSVNWPSVVELAEEFDVDLEAERGYVIDGTYSFNTTCYGPRPTGGEDAGIRIKLEHDAVMEMGRYFHEEDPFVIEYEDDYGIKEQIDLELAEEIKVGLEEEWKEEQKALAEEGEECEADMPDFEAETYSVMEDYEVQWDSDFKKDCIEYYLAHKEG